MGDARVLAVFNNILKIPPFESLDSIEEVASLLASFFNLSPCSLFVVENKLSKLQIPTPTRRARIKGIKSCKNSGITISLPFLNLNVDNMANTDGTQNLPHNQSCQHFSTYFCSPKRLNIFWIADA